MIRRVFALTESGAKEISNKEPNVPVEVSPDLTGVRRTRYVKSSGFTAISNTQNTCVASIPLDSAEDLEGKLISFLMNATRTGSEGAIYCHLSINNAPVAIGSTSGAFFGTSIAVYLAATNIQDINFIRGRMFVTGGNIITSKSDVTQSTDLGVILNHPPSTTPIPTTPHLIVTVRVTNAADSITPTYINLEY